MVFNYHILMPICQAIVGVVLRKNHLCTFGKLFMHIFI